MNEGSVFVNFGSCSKKNNVANNIVKDYRFPNLNIIGDIPNQSYAEKVQFERILTELNRNYKSIGPWNLVILDWSYHRLLDSEVNTQSSGDWWGQIDMVLISERRIVIYELKGYKVTKLHKAWSNRKDWYMEKQNKTGRIIRDKSFFDQCSRSHKYLLDFFEQEIRHYVDWDCHFDIDVRLVFKDGSDVENFLYSPPKVINKITIDECMQTLDMESKKFIKNCYSLHNKQYKMNYLSSEVFNKLTLICNDKSLLIRTSKWFKIMKENELIYDLKENTGSDRMLLPNLKSVLHYDDKKSSILVSHSDHKEWNHE